MSEKSLAVAFEDTLAENTLDMISDIAEVGLDAVLEDGLIKDIPIISTVVSLFKIGKTIYDRVYVKQLRAFIDEIRKHTLNEEKRQKYINKIKENEVFRNKELEYLLTIIVRYVGYEKPKLLAKVYIAYLDERINWNMCCQYSEILDRFLVGDFDTLHRYEDNSFLFSKDSLIRISSLGLFEYIGEHHELSVNTRDGHLYDSYNEAKYELTDFGRTLKDILFQ